MSAVVGSRMMGIDGLQEIRVISPDEVRFHFETALKAAKFTQNFIDERHGKNLSPFLLVANGTDECDRGFSIKPEMHGPSEHFRHLAGGREQYLRDREKLKTAEDIINTIGTLMHTGESRSVQIINASI